VTSAREITSGIGYPDNLFTVAGKPLLLANGVGPPQFYRFIWPESLTGNL
jgi:hypothetical protein